MENIAGFPQVFSGASILGTNGTSTIQIPVALIGKNCYIRIRHRNALETWSSTPISLTGGTLSYDFSTAGSMAFGSNQKQLGAGVYALYNGDVNQDGSIGSTDFTMIENKVQLLLSGYITEDLNGDWMVESTDYSFIENVSQLFLLATHP